MFGIVIVCAISTVILLILWVLLTRRRRCSQHRENGLQDGVQQLLLQHSLQNRGRDKDFLLYVIKYNTHFKLSNNYRPLVYRR